MNRRQRAFTYTQLIIGLTVVLILSAVAVAQFSALTMDARAGVVQDTADIMRQANESIFSKAVIANVHNMPATARPAPSITYRESVVIYTHYGYAKDAENLAKAMSVASAEMVIGDDVVHPDGAIQHGKARDPTKCQVAYTKALHTGKLPAYAVAVSDCS